MPGLRHGVLDWPYVEGLRMDEAMHPLTLMVVGLYGKTLPNQNGAPLRVHIPWKYGFKSGKSIVRIRLTDTMPRTTWAYHESDRIRLLRERESDGRSSAVDAGAREAAAGLLLEPPDADVQRLRRSGRQPVRWNGPAEILSDDALRGARGLSRLVARSPTGASSSPPSSSPARCRSLRSRYELLARSSRAASRWRSAPIRRRRCCTRPGRRAHAAADHAVGHAGPTDLRRQRDPERPAHARRLDVRLRCHASDDLSGVRSALLFARHVPSARSGRTC